MSFAPAAALDAYPRLPLAEYPTPLAFLPRLSREVERAVYVKRDDAIGPGLGGNKTRKLEYLLADAQRQGFRRVATFGGLQSNHARLTAAACRLLGLEPHLFYFVRRPASLTGNLLLNDLLGAHLHFIPFGGGSSASMTIEQASRLAHAAALARIGPHYFIPVGGHTWLGCLGYARAAVEIDEQARILGIGDARLITAAGSGGTLAGLLAGLSLAGSRLRPLGIDVGRLWRSFPDSIARLANEILDRCRLDVPPSGGPARGEDNPEPPALHGLAETSVSARSQLTTRIPHFTPTQVPLIEGQYVGAAYALPTEAGMDAIRRLAQVEGILLDPVYTGKAFAGLLDLIRQGAIAKDEPVIFLHTGGAPALFA